MPQSVPFIPHQKNKLDGYLQMATCIPPHAWILLVKTKHWESLPHLLEGHSCLLYEHIFISKARLKAAQRLREKTCPWEMEYWSFSSFIATTISGHWEFLL